MDVTLANMNDRETLEVQLNVFGDFDPVLPESFRNTPFVFLANGVPEVQRKVLSQIREPRFVMADTMDLWIREYRPDLLRVLRQIDGLVLNDEEARLLTEEDHMVKAGRAILQLGPRIVVVKKGEHGTLLFTADQTFALPAYPTEALVDPDGCRRQFRGGRDGVLGGNGDGRRPVVAAGHCHGDGRGELQCGRFQPGPHAED